MPEEKQLIAERPGRITSSLYRYQVLRLNLLVF